jgi:hypothetical protein
MIMPKRDRSMHVRAAMRQQLISRDTALAICRMVIADLRGEAECQAQEPFVVEDGSDVWKIRGSTTLKPDAVKWPREAGPI